MRTIVGHFMYQVLLDFTVSGRRNMTMENTTFAERFQAFLFDATKEQFHVSVVAMYGLRG